MPKRKIKHKPVNGYCFIIKPAEMLESQAYRNLDSIARDLLDEFLIICTPSRNGRISLTTKKAAERIGVSENTILGRFDMLVAHGFIVMTKGEVWVERMAREWRITCIECNGKEPTNDWELWTPGNPVRITSREKRRSKKLKQTASENKAPLPERLKQNPKSGINT